MKSFNKPLLITAAALALVYFTRKIQGSKILNVKIKSLRLDPISRAAIILEIINPSGADFLLSNIVADINISGQNIATVNFQNPTRLLANSTNQIEIPISINPIEGSLFLYKLFVQKSVKLNSMNLKGTLRGENFNLPININQNFV
jgi:hypothetical protein